MANPNPTFTTEPSFVKTGSDSGWPRCIAHLDLDAFYASVEEVENPGIAGLPIMVVMGNDTTSRGAVATCSYAARRFGVHSAMPVAQARKLCPNGVYLPVRHSLYQEYSGRIMKLLTEVAPCLEQVSIDEAYLDLSEATDSVAVAEQLQQRISAEVGLSASVGLATNKLTAKMASGYHKPRGFTIVLPGHEAAFLAEQPVAKLFGVGPKSAARLRSMGLETIGDLAAADINVLRATFGPRLGLELQEHAVGFDNRPVLTEREAKSLSYEQTLFDDVSDRRELWRQIQQMATGLESRLKTRGLLARTVAIKLRFTDWKTVTRAETLLVPTDEAATIAQTAGRLMAQTWKRGTPLRLIGVRVSNFVEDNVPRQLILPNINFARSSDIKDKDIKDEDIKDKK